MTEKMRMAEQALEQGKESYVWHRHGFRVRSADQEKG